MTANAIDATALAGVLDEIAETLKYQGSLAPTAFVLPDPQGQQFTILSLAHGSEQKKQESAARVRAAVADKQAVAVAWALDVWERNDATGERGAMVAIEVQTRQGDWYRLHAPILDDEAGDSTIDRAAALATWTLVSDRQPLFATAF